MTDPADKDAEIDFRAVGFTIEAAQFPRPPLAVAMLAAFNNVSADQLHAGQRYFPNENVMRAWERVADTARLTIIAEFEEEIERTIKRNADLDAEIAVLKAEVAKLQKDSEAGSQFARDVGKALADRDKLLSAAEARVKELEAGLRLVRGLIVEGAATGFNPLDGDWAERLYASQGITRPLLSPEDKTNG